MHGYPPPQVHNRDYVFEKLNYNFLSSLYRFYLAHYETPYVVRLWNANPVSSTQTCFTFHHPNNGNQINLLGYVDQSLIKLFEK